MNGILNRFTLGRASLATVCLVLVTLLATQLVPVAQADPPVQPTCVAAAPAPCGGTCPMFATECRPVLNGWMWGTCGLPNNKVKPCTQNGQDPGPDCGDEYDCANGYIASCNLGPFPTCAQR